MKLYNTLTKKTDSFQPVHGKTVHLYSCGPTVYDHVHIGNLSSFIAADTLRRALTIAGHKVTQVMNFTDIDDKTIKRSQEKYPDINPKEALHDLTEHYTGVFLNDMQAVGNDISKISFVKATDNIKYIKLLISELYKNGFAYIADDGVYFSIEKYQASGKKYGQLLAINASNTSDQRIQNDEYDKKSVHDFALWKLRKDDEPAWEFELDGHNLIGRPGWHIECSAMSGHELGQPLDIHTGGVDLIFPHHENEIAQSTAGKKDPIYAKYFVHNEHLLVNGRKMSKSLNNFYTLRDVIEKGYDPLAFRLMVLQAHYRKQTNFTWENLKSAENRLRSYQAMADIRWQTTNNGLVDENFLNKIKLAIREAIEDDMDTPSVLTKLSQLEQAIDSGGINSSCQETYLDFLKLLDGILGLQLHDRPDLAQEYKDLMSEREKARNSKNWEKADDLRLKLHEQDIDVRDTPHGQIWGRA